MSTFAPGGSAQRDASSWHAVARLLVGVCAALLVAATASAASAPGVLAAGGRYVDPVFTGVRVASVKGSIQWS